MPEAKQLTIIVRHRCIVQLTRECVALSNLSWGLSQPCFHGSLCPFLKVRDQKDDGDGCKCPQVTNAGVTFSLFTVLFVFRSVVEFFLS